MADNAVVKIGDIECSIGPYLQIDRMKPRVIASDKVFGLFHPRRRASPRNHIAMHDIGDDVADVEAVAIVGGIMSGIVMDDTRDAGGIMTVDRHRRSVAKSVVWLSE